MRALADLNSLSHESIAPDLRLNKYRDVVAVKLNPTHGVEPRTFAIHGYTFEPGN